MQHIQSLAAKYPLVGSVAWLLSFQFFILQAVAASSWQSPLYSWRLNAISDLGATSCGMFDDRLVCSPLHSVMNTSLILLGIGMVVGSVLLYVTLRRSRVAFLLMALAGVGVALVGVFPEDSIFWAHIVGQDLAFVFGNIALIIFGLTLRFPRWFKWYSIASGLVALVALMLFLSHQRFFLELGGMERVVAYPLIVWLIVTGMYTAVKRDVT